MQCVIRQATATWRASAERWNNAYLKQKMGDATVSIECALAHALLVRVSDGYAHRHAKGQG